MRLYEINAEFARLQERVEWDGERYIDLDTGEIMTDEELDRLFEELGMAKDEILRWLAKSVINDRAEAEAIKAEEKRLKERRERFEKRAERFEDIIRRECGGVTTDLGVATMAYRKSQAVEFKDEDIPDILAWLEEHDHTEAIKYIEPEVRKTELKKIIKSGEKVPYAAIVDRVNGKLK